MQRNEMTAEEYNNRGSAHQNQNNYDAAIADYSKAIELDPKFASAYYKRGSAHHAQRNRNYDAVIADYSKAIELDPKFASAYYHRGHAHHALNNYDAAIADYSKVIELDPKFASAYSNRGCDHDLQGNYAAAITDYSKAIELGLKDDLINKKLAFLLEKTSKEDIFKSIQKCPQEEAIHLLYLALNEQTPLGKRFWKKEGLFGLFKSSMEKDTFTLKKLKELYTSLTAERVMVRRVARLIAQGSRGQKDISKFAFFKDMPAEIGVMIAALVADNTLSPEIALKIARENFDRPTPSVKLKK